MSEGYIDYVPVIGAEDNRARRTDDFGHSFGWWRPTDYYLHPWVLVSPMTYWQVTDVRRRMGAMTGVHIFWDSGGFMVLTGSFPGTRSPVKPAIGAAGIGDRAHAAQVVEWYNQGAVRGDPCMILDSPIVKFKESRDRAEGHSAAFGIFGMEHGTLEQFDRALAKTAANGALMLERRTGDYDLFGVVHGWDGKTMLRWMERLQRVGQFDGWAFNTKANGPSDPTTFRLAMALSHHYAVDRPIHFLGHSGARAFVAAAYLAAHLRGARVTLDSSTPVRYASERVYIIPGTLDGLNISPEQPWPDIPCDCPVCRCNGPDQFTTTATNAWSYLTLHNLWHFTAFVRMVNSVRHRREELLALGTAESATDFAAFDYYLDKGLETFVRRDSTIGKRFDAAQRTIGEYDADVHGPCVVCREEEAVGELFRGRAVCRSCRTKIEKIQAVA